MSLNLEFYTKLPTKYEDKGVFRYGRATQIYLSHFLRNSQRVCSIKTDQEEERGIQEGSKGRHEDDSSAARLENKQYRSEQNTRL